MIFIDDAFKIMERNQGFYFAKDVNSIYYGASESFNLVAGIAQNREIQGKTDADLPWDSHLEELLYHDTHVITYTSPWAGYERGKTAFSSDEVFCFSNKIPMMNSDKMVIGTFGVMMLVSDNVDISLLTHFERQYKAPKNYHFVTPEVLQQLTAQELICWFFIIRGKTVKQIAKAMTISPKTTEFHLINLKNKLNVQYKKDLIDHAFTNNLLQFIPPTIRTEKYVNFLNEA